MVYRRIFRYNKWESVRAVIDGCGRLDVRHLILMQMRKIQFYKRIFYKNDCVLHKLFCAMMSRDNMYDKCMMSVFTRDAARNVYMQFRAHLADWGTDELTQWFYFSVLLFSVFSLIMDFCILLLYCIVLSFLPLANTDAHCSFNSN